MFTKKDISIGQTCSLLLAFAMVTLSVAGCSSSSFSGGSSRPAQKIIPKKFEIKGDVVSSLTEGQVWAVTSVGNTYRWKLDKDQKYAMTSWTGMSDVNNGGHRTFVSEIGLIVGETGVGIWRISDDATTAQQIIALPGANRICTTSFKIGAQPYIGATYTGGSGRKFLRLPIDETKTNKVDVSKIEYFDVGSGSWGYSCFMDQSRGILWSKYYDDANLYGINVTATPVTSVDPATSAPNKNWTAATAGFDFNLTGKSYALAGDANGNILNAGTDVTIYTMAHDPVTDVVFISYAPGQNKFTVVSGACAADKSKCDSKSSATFYDPVLYAIGPMSSLNDGRVVGLARGAATPVLVLSVKDPSDLSKGLNVTKIADVPGDTYMYTDFTGATLYAATIDKVFDLTSSADYKAGKNISAVSIAWSTAVTDKTWMGLKLGVRCYKKGADTSAIAFTDITGKVQAAETVFAVDAPTCKGQFDQLETKIEPDGSSGRFSQTSSMTVSFTQ